MPAAVGRVAPLLRPNLHLLAVLGLVLLIVAGCASSASPDAKREARHGGLVLTADAAGGLGYVANWATTLPVERRGRLVSAEVLGDVVVIVEEPTSFVRCLSLRDGKVLWQRVVGDDEAELYTPVRWRDDIIINSSTRAYRFRARDGETRGVFELAKVATTGGCVVDDKIVFGGTDGTVFAQRIESGLTEWQYRLSSHLRVEPIVVGNNVFAADAAGIYAMVNPNGQLLWRSKSYGPVVVKPAYDQANVYLPSTDGTLYALERSSGRDAWQFRSQRDLTLPARSYDTLVVLAVPNERVIGLDPVTGEQRWSLDGLKAFPVGRLGDRAVLAGGESLLLVDLDSGRIAEQAETLPLAFARQGPDESLILVSRGGQVLRVNPVAR